MKVFRIMNRLENVQMESGYARLYICVLLMLCICGCSDEKEKLYRFGESRSETKQKGVLNIYE